MQQSRLDEDEKISRLIHALREKGHYRTIEEDVELRRLSVIYYVDHGDVRNYWIPDNRSV